MNVELKNEIIKKFYTDKSIGAIAYGLKIQSKAVIRIWKEEFGTEEIKKREIKIFGTLVKCPVCNIEGSKEFICRHLMNSQKEENHKKFIKKQDEEIKQMYLNIKDEDFDINIIVNKLL